MVICNLSVGNATLAKFSSPWSWIATEVEVLNDQRLLVRIIGRDTAWAELAHIQHRIVVGRAKGKV